MSEPRAVTVTVTVAIDERLLKMRERDMRDQLAQDDALCSLLGRQVLAKARAQAFEQQTEDQPAASRTWGD